MTVVKLFQANNQRSARLVENAIQSMFMDQDVGKRLYRCCHGGGPMNDSKIGEETHTVAVVLDLQGNIKKAIENKEIEIDF